MQIVIVMGSTSATAVDTLNDFLVLEDVEQNINITA
jgi:hypothetical protein